MGLNQVWSSILSTPYKWFCFSLRQYCMPERILVAYPPTKMGQNPFWSAKLVLYIVCLFVCLFVLIKGSFMSLNPVRSRSILNTSHRWFWFSLRQYCTLERILVAYPPTKMDQNPFRSSKIVLYVVCLFVCFNRGFIDEVQSFLEFYSKYAPANLSGLSSHQNGQKSFLKVH